MRWLIDPAKYKRPRLCRSTYGGWYCDSVSCCAIGETPLEAYTLWAKLAPGIAELWAARTAEQLEAA